MTAEIEQKRGSEHRYDRIESLSPDRKTVVDNMLIRGDAAGEVVRVIQQEWALYQDVSVEALERQIQRYKRDRIAIPAAAKQQLIDKLKEAGTVVQQRIAKKLDDFDVELHWLELIKVQQKRVLKWAETGADQLPTSAVRDDIKLLHQMYKDLATHYLETGRIRRAPRQVNGVLSIDDEGKLIQFEAEMKNALDARNVIGRMIELIRGEDYEVVDGQQPDSSSGDDSEEDPQ